MLLECFFFFGSSVGSFFFGFDDTCLLLALDIVAIDGIVVMMMLHIVGVDIVGVVDNNGKIVAMMLFVCEDNDSVAIAMMSCIVGPQEDEKMGNDGQPLPKWLGSSCDSNCLRAFAGDCVIAPCSTFTPSIVGKGVHTMGTSAMFLMKVSCSQPTRLKKIVEDTNILRPTQLLLL